MKVHNNIIASPCRAKVASFALLFSVLLVHVIASAQVSSIKSLVETNHNITCIAYSPDGNYIATGGSDGRVVIRSAQTGEVIKSIDTSHGQVNAIRFANDAITLATGGTNGSVTIWDITSGNALRTVAALSVPINSIDINSTSTLVATAGKDKNVIILNYTTGETLHTLSASSSNISSVAFHPVSDMVMAVGNDGYVTIWDTTSGGEVKTLRAEEGAIKALSFSPNGNFFITGGDDSMISMRSAYSHSLENTILAHSEAVNTLCYSYDGQFVMSGGDDKLLVITEVKSGSIVYYAQGHASAVTSVAFNPSGKEAASASSQSDTLKLWDVSSLGISPFSFTNAASKAQKPKPQIAWITENNKESISLGYSVRYNMQSEFPIEKLNVYVNNEKQSTETSLTLASGDNKGFESIVYLKDGSNEVKLEMYYSEGVTMSEPLTITYRADLAEELVKASRTRKITVWLRETDEYEYVVSGAEGYLFHSEKIKVDEAKDESIGVELVPLKEDVSIVLNNITFGNNSADLTSESFKELDRVVELLNTNPKIKIEISAHTCNKGSDAYNMLLSDRRAQSVVNYLLDNNISTERLIAKGYGPRKPMVPNTSEENRAFNRRVEFKIIEISEQ